MKEISTITPADIDKSQRESVNIKKKLKGLFVNPKYQAQVEYIREIFNIPANGIKGFLGVTDKVSSDENKRNLAKFNNLMSLMYEDQDLKALKVSNKSKKRRYDEAIKRLRKQWDLPVRYQDVLAQWVVPYNKIPDIYSHTYPALVKIYEDRGEKRIFIEIYGDTNKQDILKAWSMVKSNKLISKYKLKGSQLYRYKNYYEDILIEDGNTNLVERMVNRDISYPEKYARSKRLRDFRKKHNYSK